MSSYETVSYPMSDGTVIVAEVAGPVEAPTVILSHGGGQTRHSWAEAMSALVGRGYRVINYDTRGHGDSDWSPQGDYSTERLAEDLTAIIATTQGPVGLVGASMGGMSSFYAVGSSRHPIASALIMVDIVMRTAKAGADHIRSFMCGNPNGFASVEEAADAVATYYPERARPSSSEGLRKNLRQRENGRFYWHWDPRLMEASPSSEPPADSDALFRVADKVALPVLVVRGSRSDIVDDAGVEEMCRLVPQTEIYDVNGAGHMVAGDKNDAFNAGVFSFLDRHLPL